MTVYDIYYKDVCIGLLEINERGQHRYTPIAEGIGKVEEIVPLDNHMTNYKDWGEPIPIWKNKIARAKRFGHEEVISSHTDCFRLVIVHSHQQAMKAR